MRSVTAVMASGMAIIATRRFLKRSVNPMTGRGAIAANVNGEDVRVERRGKDSEIRVMKVRSRTVTGQTSYTWADGSMKRERKHDDKGSEQCK